MKLAICAALVVVAATGCKKDDAAARAKAAAAAKNFWPDAPKPTVTTGKRTLAYQPDNLHGYTVTMKAGTTAGAEATINVDITLGLELVPGYTKTIRDAMLRKLTMKMDAETEHMELDFDGQALTIKQGTDEPVTIHRGDESPIKLEDIADKPVARLEFGTDGSVFPHPVEDPLELDDSLDTALILFPDLPTGEIAVGKTWTVKRTATLGNNLGAVDVTYTFVYAGDGPCPSGTGTCAHLTFTAASDSVHVEAEGHSGTAKYGFAGKVFLNDRGAIDESRVRMDVDVDVEGHKLPMGGVYTVKPT